MTTFGRDPISVNDRQLMDIQTTLELQFPQELKAEESTAQTVRRLLTELKDIRALNNGKITELSMAMRLANLVKDLSERRDDLILMSSELSDVIVEMDAAAKRAGITITDDVAECLEAVNS